jgi:hypothetical protein
MKEMEEGDCKKKEIRCYQDFESFQVLQANLFCLACTINHSVLRLRDGRNCFDREIYNVVSEHHFGSSSLKNKRAEVPSKSIQFSESWIKNKTITYAACPRLTLSGFS